MDEATTRAVRRLMGVRAYDAFTAAFTTADVADLWAEIGNVRLMAAMMLEALADSSGEALRKLGDVTVDNRGQSGGYLTRAAELRRSAFGMPAAFVAPWGVQGTPEGTDGRP